MIFDGFQGVSLIEGPSQARQHHSAVIFEGFQGCPQSGTHDCLDTAVPRMAVPLIIAFSPVDKLLLFYFFSGLVIKCGDLSARADCR